MGGLDQATEFIDSQGPAVMAAVFFGVEPRHSGQGIGPGSTTLPTPLGERSDGGSMVVDGLKRKSFVTKGLQSPLNAIGVKAGQSIAPGNGRDTAGSVGGQVGMLGGCSLGQQGGLEVGQVIGQGAGLVVAVRFGLAVDQTSTTESDLVFKVVGDPLGFGLVGASGGLAAAAVFVEVLDDVLHAAFGLEYSGHRVRLLLAQGSNQGGGLVDAGPSPDSPS